MLNAEDRYASISREGEFRGLLRDEKPVVLYDLAAGRCLWCNVASAFFFADGGLHAMLEQPVPGFQMALGNLKALAGRLVHEGQKTLARIRVSSSPIAGMATISIQRRTLPTGERAVLIRFLDAPPRRIDDQAVRRFFFGYDDVRNAVLPTDDRQVELPFNTPSRAAAPAMTEEPEAAHEPAVLTPDEEDKFKAIADALGMRLADHAGEHADEQDDVDEEPADNAAPAVPAPSGEARADDIAADASKETVEPVSDDRPDHMATLDEYQASDPSAVETVAETDVPEEDEGAASCDPAETAGTDAKEDTDEPSGKAEEQPSPARRELKIVSLRELHKDDDKPEEAAPLRESGKLIQLFRQDKKIEADQSTAAEADWQPVVLVRGGSVLEANKAALKLFAVSTQEELARSDGFAALLIGLRRNASPIEVYNAAGEALRLDVATRRIEAELADAQLLVITSLKDEIADLVPLADEDPVLKGETETVMDEDMVALDAEAEAEEHADTALTDAETEHDALPLEERELDGGEVFFIEEETEDADVTALREEVADLEASCEELERALAVSRAREAELRAVLATATDGVLVLDAGGRVISMNSGAEALLGQEEETILGRHFTELLTLESRASARSYFEGIAGYSVNSLINDGREVKGMIGGKEASIALFMSIGRLGDENPARFSVVLRDITPWKKTEAELLEARRRAELASQQKTEFLAKISHEVRTPLNAIIGFSDVMLEERFGPIANQRYRSYLQDIKQGGKYVISLVNDLLDLAKIEAGRMEMNFEQTSLNEIVHSVQSMVQPQAAQGRVIMRYSLSDGLPDVVADQRALKQVLINILSNAVKFTDAGGQVIVSTRREDDGGVAIRIRDTGEGMSAEEVALALKPFRQVGGAKVKGGTGLGLPLSRALTEANRARFSIDSEKGVGTSVSIVFPVQQVCKSS